MIRQIILKWLLWALEPQIKYVYGDQDKINEWLARQYADMGFREYFKRHDIELLRSIASTTNEKECDRLKGQRMELLSLLHRVDAAYKAECRRKDIEQKKLEYKKYVLQKEGRQKKIIKPKKTS